MAGVKLPDYFYNLMTGWYAKFPSISTDALLLSFAINDYNEKLKKLSSDELQKLNNSNVKLCYSWVEKKMLEKNARGYKG